MRIAWNQARAFDAVAVAALTVVLAAVVAFSATSATAAPVTTRVSIPFSGILATDIEGISVGGTLNIVTEVSLTPPFLIATVHANISNATGIGTTSGQHFVAVGASLQTCGLPVDFGSNADPLQLTLQYRLMPSHPLASSYQHIREGALSLILQLTFRNDGTLAGANAIVGRSRFTSIPVRLLVANIEYRSV